MYSYNEFSQYRDKQYEDYLNQWEDLKYCKECDMPFSEAGDHCSQSCFESSLI